MKTDDEIIDDVVAWQKLEAELNERRTTRRRRFWSRMGLGFGFLVVVSSLGVLLHRQLPQLRARQTAQEAEDKAFHEAQEQAWQSCLNELGLSTCDRIESRLAARCLAHREEHDMKNCLQAEISAARSSLNP